MSPVRPPPRQNLTIIICIIALYKLWHEFIPHFPKDSRYTLGIKIDSLIIEIAELIFIASRLNKNLKTPYIQKAISKLDLLKFFLQISWEIKSLDNKKYIVFSEYLDEIGRILGGWQKQLLN
ncbi:MAG: four helix bundle protein [Candidatus Terrybacteria bacterium]|nr:four helix bundle protein [Candidatus Terrybacteria bacterium]